MSKILLLGGTEEAREISERLDALGADFVVSLSSDIGGHYPGKLRRGGFGGEDALAEELTAEGYTMVIDATHPFAVNISPAAKRAAKTAKVRYLRLERRPWRRGKADRWIDVRSLEEAAEQLDNGSSVFLTVGAHGLAPFLMRRDLRLVVRAIEKPEIGTRRDITILRDRGPFEVDHERTIFARYKFDAMVTKNSGGAATAAKLIAARERRTLVYMVKRPRGQPWVNARTVDGVMRKIRRYL